MEGRSTKTTKKATVSIDGSEALCFYGANSEIEASAYIQQFNDVQSGNCLWRKIRKSRFSKYPSIAFRKTQVLRLRYWLRKHCSVKKTGRSSIDLEHFELLGRKCRILPGIMKFQVSDNSFDRWANSLGASYSLPDSEAEFLNLIEKIKIDIKLKRYNLFYDDDC